jgi:hypothetical protein
MLDTNAAKIKSVEIYGKRYKTEFLQDAINHKDIFYKDWQEALLFFCTKFFIVAEKMLSRKNL